jgi:hypothetical protein
MQTAQLVSFKGNLTCKIPQYGNYVRYVLHLSNARSAVPYSKQTREANGQEPQAEEAIGSEESAPIASELPSSWSPLVLDGLLLAAYTLNGDISTSMINDAVLFACLDLYLLRCAIL